MTWLTDWDDLIHGSVVFSAIVPFVIAFACARMLPQNLTWAAPAAGMLITVWWLFGKPNIIPHSSDDVALASIGLASGLFGVSLLRGWENPRILTFLFLLLGLLAWQVYPAWLAQNGGFIRKFIISFAVTASATCVAAGAEQLCSERKGNWACSLATFLPPTVALAVLLQLGGSARFGQATGALAATLCAICIIAIRHKMESPPRFLAMLWGILFTNFAWSGWLFAEIRYGLALILFSAPVAAVLVQKVPPHWLPGKHPVFKQCVWAFVASACISGIIAGIAISKYLAEMAESEGY